MQRQDEITLRGEGSDRLLSLESVRVHHAHIQGGLSASRSCGICAEGLGGAMAEDKTYAPPEPEVAPSDGGDEKDDASPSPSDWPSGR